MKKEFSIIPNDPSGKWNNERTSYYCEKHHVFNKFNRKKSELDGLVVFLSIENHRGTNGVHGKNGHELDIELKKIAQESWMHYYNFTQTDFIVRYGRNYL